MFNVKIDINKKLKICSYYNEIIFDATNVSLFSIITKKSSKIDKFYVSTDKENWILINPINAKENILSEVIDQSNIMNHKYYYDINAKYFNYIKICGNNLKYKIKILK